MKTSCLLIGGDYDGHLAQVDSARPSPEILLPVKSTLRDAMKATAETHVRREQSYVCCKVRDADGSDIFVYLCGGNVNQPLRRLIEGYRPQQKARLSAFVREGGAK